MPQLTNLVLTDRAATPVPHTFTPEGIEGNVAMTRESTGSPIADSRFTISHNKVSSGSRRKITMKLEVPVTADETINGVTRKVVLRKAYVDLSFNFAQDSTQAERNNVVGMTASALAPAAVLVNDTVVKLEGIY